MWSSLLGSLIGLAISAAMVFGMYTVSLEPLLNYDYNSFYVSQTKSAVYTRGLGRPEDVTGKVINPKMFTPAHLIMLPAVDIESTKGIRALNLYRNITFNHTDTRTWSSQYIINLESIYNKHSTFVSITPSMNNINKTLPNNFNAVVSGVDNDTSLIFYEADKKERQREE